VVSWEPRRDARDRARTEAFGTRVRALREASGMSQEKLAEAAEVHRAEIGFIERAEREVGITMAWRIADGLGVSLRDLVSGLL
jgi:transcriptional regulator with XRE-family HTH domain